eukprot:TRINITY_DN19836_c0_g1_i1.p1 TRINITY_DN19836_c0_g1~~TRINITY_DN19836_c0_g1_i1.p1  ORF type:complete len:148 (-),score=24.00 TRINITY_DN19836_c0_g1_i1:654-1097(-)
MMEISGIERETAKLQSELQEEAGRPGNEKNAKKRVRDEGHNKDGKGTKEEEDDDDSKFQKVFHLLERFKSAKNRNKSLKPLSMCATEPDGKPPLALGLSFTWEDFGRAAGKEGDPLERASVDDEEKLQKNETLASRKVLSLDLNLPL